jgi:hypothetical protein
MAVSRRKSPGRFPAKISHPEAGGEMPEKGHREYDAHVFAIDGAHPDD